MSWRKCRPRAPRRTEFGGPQAAGRVRAPPRARPAGDEWLIFVHRESVEHYKPLNGKWKFATTQPFFIAPVRLDFTVPVPLSSASQGASHAVRDSARSSPVPLHSARALQ